MRALDRIDIKILAILQRDGRITFQRLAEQVGLSARPCLERVRRLEAAGLIVGYQAVLDLARLGAPITVFAEIALESQSRRERFERQLADIDAVVECWELSGTFDYLARFVCADVASYEATTAKLIASPELGVSRIVSHIALRPVRRFSGYPMAVLDPAAR